MLHPRGLKLLGPDMLISFKLFSVIQLIVVPSYQIPLSHFNSKEVSTWSALNSPRVVELFGAVREGLNVVLFMDLKSGKLNKLHC